MGARFWSIAGSIAAGGAAIAARKATAKAWTKVTDNDPPANPANRSTSWPEAIAWTVMVGVVASLARLVVVRILTSAEPSQADAIA